MIGTRRRAEERYIHSWRLDKLTPHPLNERLYGSSRPNADLIASIRELGVLEPMIVTQSGQIISGHSRWAALKIICAEDGVSEKTVFMMSMRPDRSPADAWYSDEARRKEEDDNPLLLERMLIEANRQRTKTPEQKGREFIELKRIETALAKQRQTAAQNNDAGRAVPKKFTEQDNNGEAAVKAAAAVGLSRPTANKLEDIVKAADAGKPDARAALDAVNAGDKSISGAHKALEKPAPTQPKRNLDIDKRTATELHQYLRAHGVPASVNHMTKHEGRFGVTIAGLTEDQVRELPAAVPTPEPTPKPALELDPFVELQRFISRLHPARCDGTENKFVALQQRVRCAAITSDNSELASIVAATLRSIAAEANRSAEAIEARIPRVKAAA